MSNDEQRPRATFREMSQGTREDWTIIGSEFVRYAGALPDRILGHLELLAGGHGGFPVDRLTHSLQTATLAQEAGHDDEYVVCALLHDIGDSLGSYNHPDIAAAILRPFVSEENVWMVEKHGVFQASYMLRDTGGDIQVREALSRHRYYPRLEQFCLEYDGKAFDPKRPTRPLTWFAPLVYRLFARPRVAS